MAQADAVVEAYTTSLEDLTFNSKPHINALTMLAEEYLQNAELIVRVIEAKLHKAPSNGKLPVMYLMDSIVKNVGVNYKPLFAKNIVRSFFSTFEKGDEKTKVALYKLRSTWDSYFPLKKLYELDLTVSNVDPNWPVKPLPPSLQDKPASIHVNPKFLKKAESSMSSAATTLANVNSSASSSNESADLKQDLINKQKQILELQQQKLLLELEQTKQQIAMKEKRTVLAAKKVTQPPKDPRLKQGAQAQNHPNLRVTLPNGQKQPPKDPRTAAAQKQNPRLEATKPDPRVRQPDFKKSPTDNEKAKPALKKSPQNTEKTRKKKTSPNDGNKVANKSIKAQSPKAKPEPTKKIKGLKKKNEGRIVKKASDDAGDMPQKTEKEQVEKARPLARDNNLKRRERPVRRSPPRDRPAKQPRRSTSVERRKSPSPPRRNSENLHDAQRLPRASTIREEELRRDSPRSNEGSISPRFSPEPDESSPGKKRQAWRPPVKRPRHQELPPNVWGPGEPRGRNLPPGRRRSSVDPNLTIPQELTLAHQAEILKQAEIQLQTGQLTHSQHQDFLKQLHQLFELQRMRIQHPGQDQLPIHAMERPRMPLDEILPEHHDEPMGPHGESDFRPGHGHPRHGENRPPSFRPPPSPPHMDVDRDDGYRNAPRMRQLTPPPLLPVDPRINRNMPPHREDPRYRGEHGNFPVHHNADPGLRDNRQKQRPPHESGPPPPHRMDRRSSPNRRRGGSDSWDNKPGMRRGDVGKDMGNVFVMEEENHFEAPPHQRGPISRREENNPDLQNGSKPLPGRVPLRAYAHPDSDGEVARGGQKRRNSFEGRQRSRRSPTSGKLKEGKHSKISVDSTPSKEQSDSEHDGPLLEEPEDYIIANIPRGAEAYHEHSMKLKGGNPAAVRAYQEHKKAILAKQLSGEGSKEDENDASEKSLTQENLPSEALSSPDISKRNNLEEEVNKSPSLPLKKRKYLISSSDAQDSGDGGVVTEPEAESKPVDTPKNETSAMEEVKKEPDEGITDSNLEMEKVKEEDVDNEDEKEKSKDSASKEEEEKLEVKEEAEKASIESERIPTEKSASVGKETTEDTKRLDKKKGRKKRKERGPDGRLKRIQQLATGEGKTEENQDMGRRGKQFPRRRMDEEEMQERRMQSLMEQEEDRLRWDAELEMKLRREEFHEMRGRGRMNRGSPPRRGWGRGHEGQWRGRGGPPRGRGGWGRGEFWDDDRGFRGRPRPSGRMMPPRGERVDDWDRPWGDRGPGPMRGPIHGHPGDRMRPPHPEDRRMMDGPPRGPSFGGSPPRHPPPFEPAPKPPPPEMNQVNVNKLLSDLLNMGIIPGPSKPSEPEKPPNTPPASQDVPQPAVTSTSAAPVKSERPPLPNNDQEELSSVPKDISSQDANRVPTPVFGDLLTTDPNEALPEIKLDDLDKLKIRHDEVIKRLYTGIQCSACGMRFTACQTDMYAEHLDWHYRLNRKDKEGFKETHRMLYPTAGDWIMYEEIVDPSQRAKNAVFDEAIEDDEQINIETAEDSEELVVPAALNPGQDKCAVCNEAFKPVYSDEAEEWQYVNCVTVDGKNFHPSCYADHQDGKDVGPLPTPIRVPLYNPMESSLQGIPGLDSLTKEESEGEENDEKMDDAKDTADTNVDVSNPTYKDISEETPVGTDEASMETANAKGDTDNDTANDIGEGGSSEVQELSVVKMETEQPANINSETDPLPQSLSSEEKNHTPSGHEEDFSREDETFENKEQLDHGRSEMEAPNAEESEELEKVSEPSGEQDVAGSAEDQDARHLDSITSETPEMSPSENDMEKAHVKVENDCEPPVIADAQSTENIVLQPFVMTDSSSSNAGATVEQSENSAVDESYAVKNEPVSPSATDINAQQETELDIKLKPPLESSDVKSEQVSDESVIAFSIPTLVTKTERDDSTRFTPPSFDTGPEFDHLSDEPLPPGTEPVGESEMQGDYYSDSGSESGSDDINVTLE